MEGVGKRKKIAPKQMTNPRRAQFNYFISDFKYLQVRLSASLSVSNFSAFGTVQNQTGTESRLFRRCLEIPNSLGGNQICEILFYDNFHVTIFLMRTNRPQYTSVHWGRLVDAFKSPKKFSARSLATPCPVGVKLSVLLNTRLCTHDV